MSWIKTKDRLAKTSGRFIVWTFAAVMAVAMAVGDVDSTVRQDVYTAAVIPSAQAAEVSAPADEQIESGPAIQSLSFKKDMSIRDALRFLSAKYQKNIVPSAGVDGIVTVTSLYDVTFKQALQAILGYGFKYDEDGNFIRVYTAEEYKKVKEDPDRMEQAVFTLYYVNSTEMRKLIAPVLSSNAIVAASTAAMQDTEAGDGGDSLAMRDTLVIYDYPEKLKKVAAMIEAIDVRPPGILLEVTILEAQLKDETAFGIDFSNIAGAAISISGPEGITSSGFASSVGGAGSTAGLTVGFKIDDVTGFIRALESITDTTVLANPKVLALNKQAGHILIGSEDGYLTTTQISADGAVQQVEFLESGTRLKFRPYVCRDGYIRMEINPEQSKGQVEVTGDFVLPSKDTTQLATNIMVKDGQTIVIGGLFKDDISQTHSQIPLLGDLPLIGHAFEQVKDVSIRNELIILLTPHIIEDPEEFANSKEAKEVMQIVEGAKESLSIVNRTRIFEERLEIAEQYYKDGYYYAALAELDNILEMRPNYPDAQHLRDKVMEKISQLE